MRPRSNRFRQHEFQEHDGLSPNKIKDYTSFLSASKICLPRRMTGWSVPQGALEALERTENSTETAQENDTGIKRIKSRAMYKGEIFVLTERKW
jgi:hypothetical protein